MNLCAELEQLTELATEKTNTSKQPPHKILDI